MNLSRIPLISGAFFLIFLFQEAIVNRINFFIGGFSLYIAFFIACVIDEERTSAIIVGFIAGFIADLSPTLSTPFGLWTFVLTVIAYLLTFVVRPALDTRVTAATLTVVIVLFSTFTISLLAIFGAILGQEVGSFSSVFKVIVGNALWSAILAPIYVPISKRFFRLTFTSRQK